MALGSRKAMGDCVIIASVFFHEMRFCWRLHHQLVLYQCIWAPSKAGWDMIRSLLVFVESLRYGYGINGMNIVEHLSPRAMTRLMFSRPMLEVIPTV